MTNNADTGGNFDREEQVDGNSRTTFRNMRTFSSLRNPVYRLYYGAMVCQMASLNMQMVTRSLLIYRMTGSPMLLGMMALANALPMMTFSLFGGVIADRVPKKNVLLIGQIGSAFISLGIALSLTLGYLGEESAGSWWILVVASFVHGVVMGLMMPSRQAMVADIVGTEQLMNALALNNFGMNLLRLFAPAVAGFLIELFGFQASYYVMTGLYVGAVIFIAFMPSIGTMSLGGHGVFKELKNGLQYVKQEPTIRMILVIALFAVLLSAPYLYLMPIFAEDVLDVGALGLGVLMSVSGIGAMIGSGFLASLPNKKRGIMFLISSLIVGLALTSFSFSSIWYRSLGSILFVGLGESGRRTLANTLLMYYVEDDYRGRVMSIYMMEFGLVSFGVFFAGILAQTVGVQWSVGSFAMGLVALSVLALFFSKKIRKLD